METNLIDRLIAVTRRKGSTTVCISAAELQAVLSVVLSAESIEHTHKFMRGGRGCHLCEMLERARSMP